MLMVDDVGVCNWKPWWKTMLPKWLVADCFLLRYRKNWHRRTFIITYLPNSTNTYIKRILPLCSASNFGTWECSRNGWKMLEDSCGGWCRFMSNPKSRFWYLGLPVAVVDDWCSLLGVQTKYQSGGKFSIVSLWTRQSKTNPWSNNNAKFLELASRHIWRKPKSEVGQHVSIGSWPHNVTTPSHMLFPTCFQSVGFSPTAAMRTTQLPWQTVCAVSYGWSDAGCDPC